MKYPQPKFDGDTLVLPDCKFTQPDSAVPHRSRTFGYHRDGSTQYFVNCNRNETLFWVHALAPGFAGERSRASRTCATKNKALANQWRDAVVAGKVRIE